MLRKILIFILVLLIVIPIVLTGWYRFTEGNPETFVQNFRQAASTAGGHHTHLVSVYSFSWIKVPHPEMISKALKTDLGFIRKQPESFLLVVNGKFEVYGGYATSNYPIPPEIHKGTIYSLIPLKKARDFSAMSFGSPNKSYDGLKKLGKLHTLPFPLGKIVWFFLYDINFISRTELIYWVIGIYTGFMWFLGLIRRALDYNYDKIDYKKFASSLYH